MLFFKKAIVKEAMPPTPTTVYAALITFVRDVAFSICSYVPPSVVDAAMDTKVAVAGLLEGLGSSIPRSIEGAKVAAYENSRDVASSIGSNIPNDLKSMIGANDVAGGTIVLAMLLSTLLMLAALHFVFAVPTPATYDSRYITKEDSNNKVSDEGSSTAPFSGGSSSGSIGSSLDNDISMQDEGDVDKVEFDSAQNVDPSLLIGATPSCLDDASTQDDDDAPRYEAGDFELSDVSITPSFEELIKIAQDDDKGGPSPPKKPAATASVSRSSDNEDGSSGASSGSPSSTPTRSGSKMSQLRRGLSYNCVLGLGSPLRMSSRTLVLKK